MKNKLIKYLAVSLLLAVACIHFLLATRIKISPWKVGGFGMFSTVSSHYSFFIKAYYKENNTQMAIALPADVQAYQRNIFYFPTQKNIQVLKEELCAKNWIIANDSLFAEKEHNNKTDTFHTLRTEKLTVELWQLRFSSKRAVLSTALIAKK